MNNLIEEAQQISNKLERLSADSIWAHRASGLRGSLLKFIHNAENKGEIDHIHLKKLLEEGHRILIFAAKEIPDTEDQLRD